MGISQHVFNKFRRGDSEEEVWVWVGSCEICTFGAGELDISCVALIMGLGGTNIKDNYCLPTNLINKEDVLILMKDKRVFYWRYNIYFLKHYKESGPEPGL